MSEQKVPIEKISKLAEDVRLIKDFAENHNFDTSLLTADIVPATNKSKFDIPFIAMVAFTLLVLCMIGVMKFWEPPLSTSVSSFLFLVGLVFVGIASMAAHIRFQNNIITSIVVVSLLLVLFIGAGIFTPKEAVEKVGEIVK